MNVRNCRQCGRIFNYVQGPHTCPQCRDKMEEKFQEVKSFIRDNRTATISDISDECDVDTEQINQWIREERLEFADDSPVKLTCENCATKINSGRYCEKCKSEMANSLESSIKKDTPPPVVAKKEKESPKMRFLDR
ncbi:MAG: flagellar protein [Eubacteriales bacterium]